MSHEAGEAEPPTPVRFRPDVAQSTPGGGPAGDLAGKTTVYTAVYSSVSICYISCYGLSHKLKRLGANLILRREAEDELASSAISPPADRADTSVSLLLFQIPVFECMVRGIAVMRRRSDA
jgi:hypothetical protein